MKAIMIILAVISVCLWLLYVLEDLKEHAQRKWWSDKSLLERIKYKLWKRKARKSYLRSAASEAWEWQQRYERLDRITSHRIQALELQNEALTRQLVRSAHFSTPALVVHVDGCENCRDKGRERYAGADMSIPQTEEFTMPVDKFERMIGIKAW
jgi:biopolymer transport protein ExbB/TolQ